MEKALKELNELKEIQGQKGNIDQGDYMVGLYNGLELAIATIEKRDPEYKNCDVKPIIVKISAPEKNGFGNGLHS